MPRDEADEFLFSNDEFVDELLIESMVSTLSLRFNDSAGRALLLSLLVDDEELWFDELEGSI